MSKKPKFSEKEEKLIGTAVLFLSNPQVEQQQLDMKVSFLKSKGLSKAMVKEAFSRYEDKKKEQNKEVPTEQQREQEKTSTIEELIERSKTTKFLSLRNQKLTELTKDLCSKIAHVETLILNDNNLKSIPKSINLCQNLKNLQVVNCNLHQDSLPSAFYQLPALEELNISKNYIHDITALFQLPKLSKLIAYDNEIVSLPITAINTAPALKALDLRRNNIAEIVEGIRKDIEVKT